MGRDGTTAGRKKHQPPALEAREAGGHTCPPRTQQGGGFCHSYGTETAPGPHSRGKTAVPLFYFYPNPLRSAARREEQQQQTTAALMHRQAWKRGLGRKPPGTGSELSSCSDSGLSREEGGGGQPSQP